MCVCVNEVNDVNDVVNTARGVKVIIIYLQLCLRIPHNALTTLDNPSESRTT